MLSLELNPNNKNPKVTDLAFGCTADRINDQIEFSASIVADWFATTQKVSLKASLEAYGTADDLQTSRANETISMIN